MPNENDPSKQGQESAGAAVTDQPQYLTKDTLGEAIRELLPGILNPAITGHIKRFESKVEQRFQALTPKPVQEQSAIEGDEPTAQAVEQPATAQRAPAPAAKPAQDPEVLKLKAQLAKIERENERAKEDAARERRQRIEEAARESVRKSLSGKVNAGVEDDIVDLLTARKQIVIDDAGAVRLRGIAQDEPEEGLDVATGVAAFLKTEKAKHYLPPPSGAGGNRARPLSGGSVPSRTNTVASSFEQKFGKSINDALKG